MTEPKELFDKTIKCPCCKQKFTTKKVRTSRLRVLKRDEDFLNHYASEEYPEKGFMGGKNENY